MTSSSAKDTQFFIGSLVRLQTSNDNIYSPCSSGDRVRRSTLDAT